jgi:hypothetical protein
MSIYSNRISVGTAATQLVPASVMSQDVALLNAGTAVVRVGGPDVTTTAWGLPALPDNPNVARTFFNITIQPGDSLWALTASGTSEVNVLAARKN